MICSAAEFSCYRSAFVQRMASRARSQFPPSARKMTWWEPAIALAGRRIRSILSRRLQVWKKSRSPAPHWRVARRQRRCRRSEPASPGGREVPENAPHDCVVAHLERSSIAENHDRRGFLRFGRRPLFGGFGGGAKRSASRRLLQFIHFTPQAVDLHTHRRRRSRPRDMLSGSYASGGA